MSFVVVGCQVKLDFLVRIKVNGLVIFVVCSWVFVNFVLLLNVWKVLEVLLRSVLVLRVRVLCVVVNGMKMLKMLLSFVSIGRGV